MATNFPRSTGHALYANGVHSCIDMQEENVAITR